MFSICKNIIFLLCFGIVLIQSAIAEDSIENYLLLAEQELPTLELKTSEAGWLDSAQLRASIDNADEQKNSIALRLSPKRPALVKSETHLMRLRQKRAMTQYQAVYEQTLAQRYSNILNVRKLVEKRHTLDALLMNLQSEAAFYKESASTEGFNPAKLLKAEIQLDNTSLKIKKVEYEISNAIEGISVSLAGVSDTGRQISIDEIERVIKQVSDSGVAQMDQKQVVLESKLLNAKIKRDEIKDGFSIDFIQIENSSKENDKDGDSKELSIGIRLPFGDPYKKSKQQKELYNNKLEARSLMLDSSRKQQQLLNTISLNIQEYRSRKSLIAKVSKRKQSLLKAGVNQLLMELDKEKSKLEFELVEIKYEIHQNYISYLSSCLMLSQKPLRNWLDQGKPELFRSKL